MEDVLDPSPTVPEVTLSSGHKMPLIGFGTASTSIPPAEALTAAIIYAIKLGYRHFDTASAYSTEESLGQALAEALELGLIKSRDEVFITSKLWCSDAAPGLVLPAIKETLGKLRLAYLDLYLIHYPVRLKKETKGYVITEDRQLGYDVEGSKGSLLEFDLSGTWEAMEECSKLGLAKSIGVSNFGPQKLTQILQSCSIPPAVNQVEMNVAWKQEKLREFCNEKGIHVSAYSPLAAYGSAWGTMAVIDSPILKDIAGARGTTVAQVALRWVYEQGSSVIVKSYNKERMKDNLKIFEWEVGLTEDELNKIGQVPQITEFTGEIFVDDPSGPGYKSVEEFWA